MTITAIFRAGRLRRWHSNPDLAHTSESVAQHRGDVVAVIDCLHPAPSANLLRMAVRHDNGEAAPGPGDASWTAKQAMPPAIREWWEAAERAAREAIHGPDLPLTPAETDWLHFADRITALVHARDHAPHVLTGDGWPEAIERLKLLASKLGVRAKVSDVLGGIRPTWATEISVLDIVVQGDPGDETRATDKPLNQGGY